MIIIIAEEQFIMNTFDDNYDYYINNDNDDK